MPASRWRGRWSWRGRRRRAPRVAVSSWGSSRGAERRPSGRVMSAQRSPAPCARRPAGRVVVVVLGRHRRLQRPAVDAEHDDERADHRDHEVEDQAEGDERQAERDDDRPVRRRRQVDVRVACASWSATISSAVATLREACPSSSSSYLRCQNSSRRVHASGWRRSCAPSAGRSSSTRACGRPTGRAVRCGAARLVRTTLMRKIRIADGEDEGADGRDQVPERRSPCPARRGRCAGACPAGRGCASGRT